MPCTTYIHTYIYTNNPSFFSGSSSGGGQVSLRCTLLCFQLKRNTLALHSKWSSPVAVTLVGKSTMLQKVLYNIFLLLFNGQGQTCVTSAVNIKLLTKNRKEVLDHFQVTTVSSNVEGIATTLLVQDGNMYV